MSLENNPSIKDRLGAVGETLIKNRDLYKDYALILGAAALTHVLSKDGGFNPSTFAVLGVLSTLIRPWVTDMINDQRRFPLGSDDYAVENDTRLIFGYIADAWRSASVQFPNQRLRHTQGFYLDELHNPDFN